MVKCTTYSIAAIKCGITSWDGKIYFSRTNIISVRLQVTIFFHSSTAVCAVVPFDIVLLLPNISRVETGKLLRRIRNRVFLEWQFTDAGR